MQGPIGGVAILPRVEMRAGTAKATIGQDFHSVVRRRACLENTLYETA